MKKYSIIALTILFALSSVVFARSSRKASAKSPSKGKVSYSKASKSKIKLSVADVALIDRAIGGNFAELSASDKDQLVKFLKDFKDNTATAK